MARLTLRCNVFLTFSYPSHLKHLVLRAFLEDCLPEMLSKLGVLVERYITNKKSTKKQNIMRDLNVRQFHGFGYFSGKLCDSTMICLWFGCGGLGQLWEALAEFWEALGELWEGLLEKIPINRPSGRYVIQSQRLAIVYRTPLRDPLRPSQERSGSPPGPHVGALLPSLK